jgi:hypothetical protein
VRADVIRGWGIHRGIGAPASGPARFKLEKVLRRAGPAFARKLRRGRDRRTIDCGCAALRLRGSNPGGAGSGIAFSCHSIVSFPLPLCLNPLKRTFCLSFCLSEKRSKKVKK